MSVLDASGKPYTTLGYANGPGALEASNVQGAGSKRFPHMAQRFDPAAVARRFHADVDQRMGEEQHLYVVGIAAVLGGLLADAVARGLAWIEGMQSANGGWGAFDVDNTSDWLYKLPFFDFGAVIDPPVQFSVPVLLNVPERTPPAGSSKCGRLTLPLNAAEPTTRLTLVLVTVAVEAKANVPAR